MQADRLDKLFFQYPDSYLIQYMMKCKSGEILVGDELKQEFGIILDDFEDSEIKIDFTDSDKRIKFIETQCKHYEAPFAGKPFLLELFQKAFIESIYIFKIYDEEIGRWVRLIQEILFLVARKNGKTPLISALCLAELFCGDMGTKILCSSNDYEQADLAFQAINAMREESKALERVTRKNIRGIFFGNPKQKKRTGKFSCQNKGNVKKISTRTNAKEGKNIRVGMSDEVHEMKDNTPIEPIRQALSTQNEPLYFELTTEGFIDDGYLDHRLTDARKVLKREMIRRRWRIWLYTQNSETQIWQDERTWLMSNPGLGVIKKWSYLRGKIEEAKTDAATRTFVLTKDFNIKQNSAAAWLTESDIINTETFDIDKFIGKFFIGGLDYAETTDLCNAKALFYDKETRKTYTLTMYFIPETKADAALEDENKLNPEKKNYREWAKQGLVTICPGDEVDSAMVVKWFYSLYTEYKMVPYRVGFDNWHATGFKKLFGEHFGEEVLERIGMDYGSLSNPMRLTETALKNKTLIYNNNPIDRWCLKNVSLKMDNIGRVMPVKLQGQSKNRIDGALGFIIANATFSRYKTEFLERC